MSPADAQILDQAAHWLARQHASDFSDSERAEFSRWKKLSARHAEIWRHAEQLKLRMDSVPASVGMAVLDRHRAAVSRRRLLQAGTLGLAGGTLSWLLARYLPWEFWNSDFHTATGEQREVVLPDQSHILLNTATAISAQVDDQTRRVQLRAGEILVTTADEAAEAAVAKAGHHTPALIVQTAEGQLRALGTRFVVRQHARATALSVLQGAVEVTPLQALAPVLVQAGQQLRFDHQTTEPATAAPPHANAWTQGVLYAQSMRLQDFVHELQRYRQGLLQCDPEVADLPVSGVFQLRDTDRILELLTQTLPLAVKQRTRLWTTLTRA